MDNKVTAKSYTLKTESGQWLGQIVLTSDGMFSSVTDYGNFSYAWRSTGEKDFRKFLIDVNVYYFGGKMYQGMTYMINGKKYEQACQRFSEMILPALQEVLRKELESEKLPTTDNKVITFTLDRGAGEQDLVDTTMENIKSELEAEALGFDMKDEDFPIEYTIRIEKKYTQKELDELPDYNG